MAAGPGAASSDAAAARTGAPLTRKGVQTRERILDIASDQFARSGSQATSLRSIAAAAGISHAGVLRYFPDKDALLIAVMERSDQESFDRIYAAPGQVRPEFLTGDGPIRFLRGFLAVIESRTRMRQVPELYFTIAIEATDLEHPAHDHVVQRYVDLKAALVEIFTALLPGTAGERIGATAVTNQFVAILDGAQLQWLLQPDEVNPAAEARSYLELLGIDLG